MGFRANAAKPGFSLIELVVSLGIGIIVALILVGVTTTGLRHMRAEKSAALLNTNALFVANTAGYWIKEAERIDVTASSTLVITLPSNATETISQIGNAIMLNNASLTPPSVRVSGLLFTPLARSVRISFTLKSISGDEILPIVTTVALRNF